MKDFINISYPKHLANSLRLSGKDFKSEMKISALVKLYELGRVSSGIAAKALGISRIDFYELLARYNVSVIGNQDSSDLEEDILNA